MKKEVGGLLSIIFSLSLVSAQQLTDTIDSFVQEIGIQSLLLVVIFLVLFAVIFYSLKKVFPDTKSVPAIIAAAIGLISAYGIVQMDIGLEGYYYDLTDYLAISGGIVLGILPIALLVTMLVFWPYLPIILIGIGVLFVILSYFAYASAFVMTAGIFFIGLGIVSWFAIRAMLNPDNKLGGTLKTLGMIAIGIPIMLVGYSFGGFLGAILGGLFISLAVIRRLGVIGAGILGFAAVSCGFFIAGVGGAVAVLLLVIFILLGKAGRKTAYDTAKVGWNKVTFNGGGNQTKNPGLFSRLFSSRKKNFKEFYESRDKRNAEAFEVNKNRWQAQKMQESIKDAQKEQQKMRKDEEKRHIEEQNVRAAVHQKQLQEEIALEKIHSELRQLESAHHRVEEEFKVIRRKLEEAYSQGLSVEPFERALQEKAKEAENIQRIYESLRKKLNS